MGVCRSGFGEFVSGFTVARRSRVGSRCECAMSFVVKLQSAPDAPVLMHVDTWLDFLLLLSANYPPKAKPWLGARGGGGRFSAL